MNGQELDSLPYRLRDDRGERGNESSMRLRIDAAMEIERLNRERDELRERLTWHKVSARLPPYPNASYLAGYWDGDNQLAWSVTSGAEIALEPLFYAVWLGPLPEVEK